MLTFSYIDIVVDFCGLKFFPQLPHLQVYQLICQVNDEMWCNLLRVHLFSYFSSLAAVEGQELAFSWTPASGAVYRCTLDDGEEFDCEYGLWTSKLH